MKLILLVVLATLISLPVVSGETVVLGSYTLSFDAHQMGTTTLQYDEPYATEYDTLYSCVLWKRTPEKVCAIYLHDGLEPYAPEFLNDTLDLWLGYGTVRVKTWNDSEDGIIAYRGEGITEERALQAYGYSKAFNTTQDGSGVNMFIVTKTVGLTKNEADVIFNSMKLVV